VPTGGFDASAVPTGKHHMIALHGKWLHRFRERDAVEMLANRLKEREPPVVAASIAGPWNWPATVPAEKLIGRQFGDGKALWDQRRGSQAGAVPGDTCAYQELRSRCHD